MKATNNGSLVDIPQCQITIAGRTITLKSLPDISDSKSAIYNNEAIIGRSFPLYTYSHSGDRSLNIQLHFFVVDPADAKTNLGYLRLIQSAVYPRPGAPFLPPPVCQLSIGYLLSGNPDGGEKPQPLCCVLQSYSVKFPTEVAWQADTFCPFRFDVDTSWLVVYTSSDLPYQNRIMTSGR
jgi:hypothetical protein